MKYVRVVRQHMNVNKYILTYTLISHCINVNRFLGVFSHIIDIQIKFRHQSKEK